MDLSKTGGLIRRLRKEKTMTQQEVADALGVCAKTISKWENGRGFPDVSLVAKLSKLFSVELSMLMTGELPTIKPEVGNVKRTKFYVCAQCGNVITASKEAGVSCCGRTVLPLAASPADASHMLQFEKIEDEYYITFVHPMTKEHYISFVSYVRFDRVLTVRLYPEQDGALRFPVMRGGKMYYYCNTHGLFEIKI